MNSGGSPDDSNTPENPSRSGYTFGGCYASRNDSGTQFTGLTMVTGNLITVYAKQTPAMPATTTLRAALTWLTTNAADGGKYIITLNANETIAPQTLSYSGKNVRITRTGGTTERQVSLSSSGLLFTIGSGVTPTLGNNITLQGRSGNTVSPVQVNSGSTPAMNTGSKISGNNRTNGNGGTFTMSEGEISGNSASPLLPVIRTLSPVITMLLPAITTLSPAIRTLLPAITMLLPAITTLLPAIRTLSPAITMLLPAIRTLSPAITMLSPAIRQAGLFLIFRRRHQKRRTAIFCKS